ncbi:hypothetical protein QYE76_067391 [Lolium multiflorum]|uniref:Transposase (putative) gypsy type domain-containing protein n=1 Tax=Lolium multiflorum TaxID=4521 RepID=A0AAD8SDT7_LOLMU|nr:hypothetical protein QYE76_067391 [Lolium multiflorum]
MASSGLLRMASSGLLLRPPPPASSAWPPPATSNSLNLLSGVVHLFRPPPPASTSSGLLRMATTTSSGLLHLRPPTPPPPTPAQQQEQQPRPTRMTQKRHHNCSSRDLDLDLDLDLNFFVFWYNLPPANKAGGYKCPRSGIEASFFFLALSLRSFSRSSFSSVRRGYSIVSLANSGGQSPRRSSAEPPPPLRQSGATGPRVSTARSSPPRSPPARSGSSSPFRLSWSYSSSSSSMAQPSGSWRGSYMREDDIERLVRLRRIPAGVITRAPGVEVEPRPEPGERVVFGAHLDRGLGLPASNFFRRFLDFFGLQPHHLLANAFILLSCYVAFMEGYAGLWPDVEFWSRLFYIKA